MRFRHRGALVIDPGRRETALTATDALPTEAWTRLLAALSPDPAGQGAAYERLRVRLAAFFRFKGAAEGPRLVDETFDRVAKKLVEGAELDLSSPVPYFLSVARFVWLEAQRAEAQARKLREAPPDPAPEDPRAKERALSALEACLEGLMPAQRRLVELYHQGRGQARIRARSRLAEDLGISENALRIRAHRIRATLERCVDGRLADEMKPRGAS